MSTSYDTNLIVGILLGDIYQAEIRAEEETRYNELTGEPYKIKVKMLHAKFGNKGLLPVKIKKTNYSGGDEAWQNWNFLPTIGDDTNLYKIEVFLPNSGGFGDTNYLCANGIVGVALSDDDEKATSATIETLQQLVIDVKKALTVYGYTGPVKIYSQLAWG